MVAAEKTVNTMNILRSKPKQMATDLEIPYWKIWHPLQSDHSAQSSDWGFHLSPGCTPSKHRQELGNTNMSPSGQQKVKCNKQINTNKNV